jgi:hypothetical protein
MIRGNGMSRWIWALTCVAMALTCVAMAMTCVASAAAAQGGLSNWVVDPKSGCKVWNPHPQPKEAVSWAGACQNGLAQGPGVLQWLKDGVAYERDEGEWREGKQEGRGVQVWPTGRYEGELQAGEPEGRGALSSDAARYEGEFRGGRPHGAGTLKNAAGVFEGAWKGGCFNDGKRKASLGVPAGSCP